MLLFNIAVNSRYAVNFFSRYMECQHGLAMRKVSVYPSLHPSVCLSVKHMHCDKTEERSVQVFYHTKDQLA